jgi:hypothetical protein
LVAHGATFLCGVVGLVVSDGLVTLLVILSATTAAIAWFLRWRGRKWHGRAEEAKRIYILMDGLGWPEPAAATYLRANFPRHVDKKATSLEDDRYYATAANPGESRLRDILVESAFWSKVLYQRASAFMTTLVVVGGTVVLAVSIVSSSFSTGQTGVIVARVVILFLLFLIGSDVLGQVFDWNNASRRCEAVDNDLQRLNRSDSDRLLPIFTEYVIATANTTPIPTFVYRSHQEKLNELWATRSKGLGRDSVEPPRKDS